MTDRCGYDDHHEARVRAHIKTVYEFAREMFPLHDADLCVDDVFTRASVELCGASDPDDIWHLLRFALETTIERHPGSPDWWRRNADLVVDDWRATARRIRDDLLASELEHLLDGFADLALWEQSVVRLMVLATPVPLDRQHIVLGLEPAAADEFLSRAHRRLVDLSPGSSARAG
ncbi:MAG: hypothetical protein JWN39_1904 [Ilumatobacteraceae bacterium]|nr:hypothetical protein [Ilumatobacteraceae bacterium]